MKLFPCISMKSVWKSYSVWVQISQKLSIIMLAYETVSAQVGVLFVIISNNKVNKLIMVEFNPPY